MTAYILVSPNSAPISSTLEPRYFFFYYYFYGQFKFKLIKLQPLLFTSAPPTLWSQVP